MTATLEPVHVAGQAPRPLLDRVLRMRELGILLVLVLMLAATQADNTAFLSEQGIKDLLLNATILVLVAVGEAVVVITRNVDLSVGSVLGVAAFAAGDFIQGGGNPMLAMVIAVLVGAAFGVLNGLLVGIGRVPSLVVTLGTLYIIRGLDSVWVGSREITAGQLSPGFVSFGHDGLWAIPYLGILAAVVLSAVAYYLRDYRSGRECYALGSNPQAAALAGVPTRKRALGAFVLCGALAGLAGALYLARFGYADASTGTGYELTVVSAVVVGGVGFTGGTGSVYGAALGALLLTSINSVLPAIGVGSVWVEAIDGILLLLAISLDRVVALRVAGLLRSRRAREPRSTENG
ncbi:ABC transporter permease [Actinospica sp.]|uniref:ABC transporter permease n=1 Tax=Actinospica sp. TaxID=1872142 RepID=UPI002CDB1592|nr:ABC transporter permease [Actinospica sp.]HWG25059.1 ABC transporter permease [Actinospica sp.]